MENGVGKWHLGRYTTTNTFNIVESGVLERLTVLPSSGNVGLSTTTPANRLDVEGAVAIGAAYSGTTAAPANGLIIEGDVGIGTTSPTKDLEIVRTGGAYVGIDGGVNQYAILDFMDNGTAIWRLQKNPAGLFSIVEVGLSSRLTVAPGGNVGIGKNTAATALDILGALQLAQGGATATISAYQTGTTDEAGYFGITTAGSAASLIAGNHTGTGNLLQLQKSGVDKFVVDNVGVVTSGCPAGFTGVNGNFCITTAAQGSATWYNSAEGCRGQDARLCSFSEMFNACRAGGIGFTSNIYYWVDDIDFNNAGTFRNSNITCSAVPTTLDMPFTNSFNHYCCRNK